MRSSWPKGPRSVMRTRTVCPVSTRVTSTIVPKGSVRCAAVRRRGSKGSPLAVLRPAKAAPYHVAKPTWTSARGGGASYEPWITAPFGLAGANPISDECAHANPPRAQRAGKIAARALARIAAIGPMLAAERDSMHPHASTLWPACRQWAFAQLAPYPTSTTSGTASFMAPAICSRMRSPASFALSSGTSKTSSS